MTSFCSYYNLGTCRSCSNLEQTYDLQIAQKEARVRQALAVPSTLALEPTVRSALQGFRDRAKMVVSGSVAAPIIGLIEREILECPIHHPKINELIEALPEFISRNKIAPYQIETRVGELKGLILFYSPQTRQMYLRFVLRSTAVVSKLRKELAGLVAQFPELVCVTANIQPIPAALLEGPEEIFLTERKSIEHKVGGLTFNLAPNAFVQTNGEVAARLYQTAAEWIGEFKPARMLELFSGQGAFSFFSALSAGQILGVEINTEAVKTANATARSLGLDHVEFLALDATQVKDETERFQPDLILVNPPRRGLADAVEWIRDVKPRHLIYSSCDVKSLASDLEKLPDYRLMRVQVFDMFPHTDHFETLVWLSQS